MNTSAARRIATATAGALVALTLTIPASAADHAPPSSSVSQPSVAQKAQAPAIKTIRAALAKARKAVKSARLSETAAAARLVSARESASSAAGAHQAAVVQVQNATTAQISAKEALSRAQSFIDNQDAAWKNFSVRSNAANASYQGLRQAFQAKQNVVTTLFAQRTDLTSQVQTAINQSNNVNTLISDLANNRIPAANRAHDTAAAREDALRMQKDNALALFENKKAELSPCRAPNGGPWECKVNNNWVRKPRLDELQDNLNRLRAQYNEASQYRQALEPQIVALNDELARAYAESRRLTDLINVINANIRTKNAEIAQAQAAASTAQAASDQAYKTVEALNAEGRQLEIDIADAKKNLPALATAAKSADAALIQANAALAQVTPAHLSAQEAVVTAESELSAAKATLSKAKKRVRSLKKKLKKKHQR